MSERAGVSSLHRSCFPRPPEWPLGKNEAASGERAPCPGEGRGVSVGEEEVAGAGVAVSVGEPSRVRWGLRGLNIFKKF